MPDMLRWPQEFTDPTPVTGFDPPSEVEFEAFFQRMIESGAVIQVSASWMSFALSRDGRTVEFIRRGKHAWEVRLLAGEEIRLGPLLGLRECACVVVTRRDTMMVAELWLEDEPIGGILESVAFEDRRNWRS